MYFTITIFLNKLEFCFSSDTIVEGEDFFQQGKAGKSLVTESKEIKVRKDDSSISVGPGFASHNYAADMRGSESKSEKEFTVYFTDFTNLDKTIFLRVN